MNEIEKAVIRLKLASNSQIFKKYNGLTEDVTLAISALEKQINGGWIPCSERLPQHRFYENGEPMEYNVMLRRATEPTTLSVDEHGTWFDWKGNYHNIASLMAYEFDVIAWQPLPEPYKEESNG